MSVVTPQMGLTEWTSPADLFNHTQLYSNWTLVDQHNHTSGKGVQIPFGGLANQSVAAANIVNNTITGTQIANNAIGTTQLAAGAVTGAQIAANGIGISQLAAGCGPLSLATISGTNGNITNGQLAQVTNGGISRTFSLPAPLLQNIVGVIATDATSSVPAVVSSVTNGGVIRGPNFGSVTTVSLSSQFSYLILEGDGTNWNTIAGNVPGSWQALTLSANITGGSGPTPAVRLEQNGTVIRAEGQLYNNGAAGIAAGTTLATLPNASFYPSLTTRYFPFASNTSAALGSVSISSLGIISFVTTSGLAPTSVVSLDGLTYTVS